MGWARSAIGAWIPPDEQAALDGASLDPPWVMGLVLLRRSWTSFLLQSVRVLSADASFLDDVRRLQDAFVFLSASLRAQDAGRFPDRLSIVTLAQVMGGMTFGVGACPVPPIDWAGWDRVRDVEVDDLLVSSGGRGARFLDLFVDPYRWVQALVEQRLEELQEIGYAGRSHGSIWASVPSGVVGPAKRLRLRSQAVWEDASLEVAPGEVLSGGPVSGVMFSTTPHKGPSGVTATAWLVQRAGQVPILPTERVSDDGVLEEERIVQLETILASSSASSKGSAADAGLAMLAGTLPEMPSSYSEPAWWSSGIFWALFTEPEAPGSLAMLAPVTPSGMQGVWLAAMARRSPRALLERVKRSGPLLDRTLGTLCGQAHLILQSPFVGEWVALLMEAGRWPDLERMQALLPSLGGQNKGVFLLDLVSDAQVRDALWSPRAHLPADHIWKPFAALVRHGGARWRPTWAPSVWDKGVSLDLAMVMSIPGAAQDPNLVRIFLQAPCVAHKSSLVYRQETLPVARPFRALAAISAQMGWCSVITASDPPVEPVRLEASIFLSMVMEASSTALLLWRYLPRWPSSLSLREQSDAFAAGQDVGSLTRDRELDQRQVFDRLLPRLLEAVLRAPWVETGLDVPASLRVDGPLRPDGLPIPNARAVLIMDALRMMPRTPGDRLIERDVLQAAWLAQPPLDQVRAWTSPSFTDQAPFPAGVLDDPVCLTALLEDAWPRRGPAQAQRGGEAVWNRILAVLPKPPWAPSLRRAVVRIGSPSALLALTDLVDGALQKDVLARLLAPPRRPVAHWISSTEVSSLEAISTVASVARPSLPPLSFPSEARFAFVKHGSWRSGWAETTPAELLRGQLRLLASVMAMADDPWPARVQMHQLVSKLSHTSNLALDQFSLSVRGETIRATAAEHVRRLDLASWYSRRLVPHGLDWVLGGGWTAWLHGAKDMEGLQRHEVLTQTPIDPELVRRIDGPSPIGFPLPDHLLPSLGPVMVGPMPHSLGGWPDGMPLFRPVVGPSPELWWSVQEALSGRQSFVQTPVGLVCAETFTSGGLLQPGDISTWETLYAWLQGLTLERRRIIARKLGLSLKEDWLRASGGMIHTLLGRLGAIWLATTPDDASRWGQTPIVQAVTPSSLNTLFMVPHRTPISPVVVVAFFPCTARFSSGGSVVTTHVSEKAMVRSQ